MSSRYLHPIACRLPRKEKNAIDEIARTNKMSVSALTKEALRRMLFGVHPGVNLPANIEIITASEMPQDNLSDSRWSTHGRTIVPRTPLKQNIPQPSNPTFGAKDNLWRD